MQSAHRSRNWALVVVVVTGVLGACGRPSDAVRPQWTPSATPDIAVAAPGVAVRQSPTAAPPAPQTLEWYLANLPTFRPPPPSTPVVFAHDPGRTPWISRIPTTQRVAFLTIDDGFIQRPEALALLRASQVPVTLFLTVNAIRNDPGYFSALSHYGGYIEAHTLTHPQLTGLSYAEQRREICGSADWLEAQYGRRPVLFRPPFGEKDSTTLRAAYDCGMRACLFWTEAIDKGKVFYQTPDKRIRPGDIILMHFREAFAADFFAALQAIKAAGLTPAILENYVSDVHSDG